MNESDTDFQSLSELVHQARLKNRSYLDVVSVREMMQRFSLPMPKGILLPEDPESLGCLESVPSPWALKLISDDVQHKSDLGFIKLGLTDLEQTGREIRVMRDMAKDSGYSIDGFMVEEMVKSGIEVVVGGYRDRVFGTTIMFGIGGILVEVLNDVVFRICPITVPDAEDMIGELSGKALFEGVRGGPVADRDTLINLLLTIGGESGLLMTVMEHMRGVDEIDLNPIIIRGGQFSVVDALISLRNSGALKTPNSTNA